MRLGARGYRVTVVEKLDAPGGRGYVYRQDGYTFDAGPTIITAPFLLEELWALAGRDFHDEIDLREISPYYRIRFDDGSHFDYSGDHEAMLAEIRRFSPSDVDGYERFLAVSERVYSVGFDKLLNVSFDTPWKMLQAAARARLRAVLPLGARPGGEVHHATTSFARCSASTRCSSAATRTRRRPCTR